MENTKNNPYMRLAPVMLCFFAIGFTDLVGTTSNYVKANLGPTDSQTNIFPSLVFFWFLIFSVPMGVLMSRTGCRKAVSLSPLITFASLLPPVLGDSYLLILVSFSLLGTGSALIQTSLNPLLSNIMSSERLASTLTLRWFVKAIVSFPAPYIAMWGATQTIPTPDLGWRVLFPVYMVMTVAAILMLNTMRTTEEPEESKPSTFGQCLTLLGKPFILSSLLGIMCHVGIDVGTSTAAPKILMERLGMTLAGARFATSLYFIFRMAGCSLGVFVLQKMIVKTFFATNVLRMLAAMTGLFIFRDQMMTYVYIALIGFGDFDVSPIIFPQVLSYMLDKKNEISGLTIMGLFGGTISPLAMGVASDAAGQSGAMAVIAIEVFYLMLCTLRIRKQFIQQPQ